MGAPIVFISSTSEDLKRHRQAARDAASQAGFCVRMMECFAPDGSRPTLKACQEKISGSESEPASDVLVVIVAHRYGWVPEGQDGSEHKSITWLECEEADRAGQEVLAFLVDEECEWSEELTEEYQVTKAIRDGVGVGKLIELTKTVRRNVGRLRDFKAWLSGRGIRATFTTPHSLQAGVLAALYRWRHRHPEYREEVSAKTTLQDPTKYLWHLRDQTSQIDIRGLQVGSGKATRLSIDELYIPLVTTIREPSESGAVSRGSQRTPLRTALKHRLLAIVGDPGSGKTTFLRRIAFLLCQTCLGEKPEAAEEQLGLEGRPFPIYIRLAELADHIEFSRRGRARPDDGEDHNWITCFLARASEESGCGLNESFFRKQLEGGSAMVLLDGLDEAPSVEQRKVLSTLTERATAAYPECRFVLTSRPAAYRGDMVLPGFEQVHIDALEDEAIAAFLRRWCEALFRKTPGLVESHYKELAKAVRDKPEIHRMARNPVMLTALAVVHWNEKRLPEQRADLYESIVSWLARARLRRPDRPAPDLCIVLHQELALAMQDDAERRQVQWPRCRAARAIVPQWWGLAERERFERAERFLIEEEMDSGIVVSRGDDVRFWHLTFQEYLAARGLAACSEQDQRRRLLGVAKLYKPEWREVVLLLAGVLYHQGRRRVDGMFSVVLDQLETEASLADQARCFGLLGAAVRDLTPVNYQPADPRYRQMAEAVMGIFDAERSKSIEIRVAIEAAEALAQAGDPRFSHDRLDKNWVEIPAGDFWMGAQRQDPSKPNYDTEAVKDESPVHKVHLNGYQIGKYPVTVGEYRRFVEEGGYEKKEYWQVGGFGEREKPDEWEDLLERLTRPMVNVTWYEAAAYAVWDGCRLPTEAEWERAARGTEGRKYPWGNDPEPDPSLLAYYESAIRHATPVGVYPRGATPDGILDLAGNVDEWCADGQRRYARESISNPRGPEQAAPRVVRGGSWVSRAKYCRLASRRTYEPAERDDDLGFRVAKDPAGK